MSKPWQHLPRPWIADIGSGGDPWPLANILVEKFVDDNTVNRSTRFHTDGKLLVVADVQDLPFGDHELDWVRCSHVLEHTEDPLRALAELQRVSARGEAWVPTIQAEACWRVLTPDTRASGHRWLCARATYRKVVFFEFQDLDSGLARTMIERFIPCDRISKYGFGTELRIAWGWGSWPEQVEVELFGLLKSEMIEKGVVTV